MHWELTTSAWYQPAQLQPAVLLVILLQRCGEWTWVPGWCLKLKGEIFSFSAGCPVKTSGSSFRGCIYVTVPQRFWTLEISTAQHGLWKGTSACGVQSLPQAGTTIPQVMNTHCSHWILSSSPLVLTVKHSLWALKCRNIDCQLLMPALSHYSTYQLERQKQSSSTGCWVKAGDLWFRNPELFKSKSACLSSFSQLQ